MQKGDKYKCIKTINNLFEWNLFKEGDTYEVIHVEEIM